ncbi:unnamed protein product [Cuscuta epithymum]|uniref:Uncharacterized protein n=1 Tax=Cuscuta epithymum TaxID=186058 RepID=A0AAV0DP11_9ASTE|nr:unnamed protein product [Cuscuta epithymum]
MAAAIRLPKNRGENFDVIKWIDEVVRAQKQKHDANDSYFWDIRGAPEKLSLERLKKKHPQQYKRIIALCGMALEHYRERNAGQVYEFVNVQKAEHLCGELTLTFCAKKVNGDCLETFHAVGYDLSEGLSVEECSLLK